MLLYRLRWNQIVHPRVEQGLHCQRIRRVIEITQHDHISVWVSKANFSQVAVDKIDLFNPARLGAGYGAIPPGDEQYFMLNAAGTWKVCIGDSGVGDFGTLQYIGLNMVRVKYAPK